MRYLLKNAPKGCAQQRDQPHKPSTKRASPAGPINVCSWTTNPTKRRTGNEINSSMLPPMLSVHSTYDRL